MSDSGRVCNAPRSSVLFDGIPTLTGLEGDTWASQTLYSSTPSAIIIFDLTYNPTGNKLGRRSTDVSCLANQESCQIDNNGILNW